VGLNYAGRIFDNQYFAISSAGAQPIVDQLMTGSSIDSIGINGEAFLEYVDGDPLSRVWIAGVQPNSLADEIGSKPGDVIINLDESYIATDGNMADYCEIIQSHDLSSDLIPMIVFRPDDDIF
jgi:serine protease Do